MTGLLDQFDGNMSSCFFTAQWTDSSSEEKIPWAFWTCDSEPRACPGKSPAGHKTPCRLHYIDYHTVKHIS